MAERRLILLGSTGSIGTQTLAVIAHLNALHERGESPVRYRIVGLAAGRSAPTLFEQARALGINDLALADGRDDNHGFNLRAGPDAAERLIREVECDLVLAAMVGAAGLPATLAAVELGRDVALANKETLVAAGALVVPAAMKSGSRLLPVDSEHAAVWQCIWGQSDLKPGLAPPISLSRDIRRVVLTASGGALRDLPPGRAYAATPAEALRHPTWTMGPKVTIDSASLMNKALEVIEAHWLFGLDADRISAIIHPQSIVHALVEYADGSVMAQLAPPDMRTPIQLALSWPGRPAGAAPGLDWASLSRLDFRTVDPDRYPALGLARRAITAGGTAGAVLNAANEAAVAAFLAQSEREPGPRPIPFGRIAELVADAMDAIPIAPLRSLADVLAADARARAFIREELARDGHEIPPPIPPRHHPSRAAQP
ncbi:MAG: 1-deoxy-D-xylulose-5-phosphate reductoisomerase [Phycisphaerales bacterium]|nr:1-deoxy-D-xylulose-5-phosphate reductoisomerase [Phycisphaerales bacterium]